MKRITVRKINPKENWKAVSAELTLDDRRHPVFRVAAVSAQGLLIRADSITEDHFLQVFAKAKNTVFVYRLPCEHAARYLSLSLRDAGRLVLPLSSEQIRAEQEKTPDLTAAEAMVLAALPRLEKAAEMPPRESEMLFFVRTNELAQAEEDVLQYRDALTEAARVFKWEKPAGADDSAGFARIAEQLAAMLDEKKFSSSQTEAIKEMLEAGKAAETQAEQLTEQLKTLDQQLRFQEETALFAASAR